MFHSSLTPLLVKTPEGNLQRSMRHVGGVYTQRYNRLKKTDGPLFRGRYKAILVDQDSYLLQLSKYIHRNPLEAGLEDRLENYEWSSYLAYIGIDKPPPWLYQQEVYEQLTSSLQRKRKCQRFVGDARMPDSIQKFYSRQRLAPILGDGNFINRIKLLFKQSATDVSHAELQTFRPSVDKIVSAVSEYYGLQRGDIYKVKKGRGQSNQPRKIAMYIAQHIGGHRLTDIAHAFGLSHYGGVSYANYMLKAEMEEDRRLSRTVNIIINGLDP